MLDQVKEHYRCHDGPVNPLRWSQHQLLSAPNRPRLIPPPSTKRRCSRNHPYMVTYANNTVSNGDITVNLMETNISIDMTVIIVTTSAATLDYGIVIEVAIVIVAMHVIADPQIAHTIPRFVEPQRWLQPHVSESGSQSESSRTPGITFAMAATFVTETITCTVLNGSTAARVSKGQCPPHDGRPRQGASRCTFTNLSQRDGTR